MTCWQASENDIINMAGPKRPSIRKEKAGMGMRIVMDGQLGMCEVARLLADVAAMAPSHVSGAEVEARIRDDVDDIMELPYGFSYLLLTPVGSDCGTLARTNGDFLVIETLVPDEVTGKPRGAGTVIVIAHTSIAEETMRRTLAVMMLDACAEVKTVEDRLVGHLR